MTRNNNPRSHGVSQSLILSAGGKAMFNMQHLSIATGTCNVCINPMTNLTQIVTMINYRSWWIITMNNSHIVSCHLHSARTQTEIRLAFGIIQSMEQVSIEK